MKHGQHERAPTRGAGRHRHVWLAAAAFAACIAALGPSPVATSAEGTKEERDMTLATSAIEASGDASQPTTHARTMPDAKSATATARTFSDYVDALVALGMSTAEAKEAGDDDAASEHDQATRSLFGEMMRALVDVDAESLQAFGDLPPIDDAAPGLPRILRQNVLQLALTIGMQRRLDGAADPSALDALTSGALTTMLARPDLAEPLGKELLVGKPYLGEPHERLVLDLIAASGEGLFAQNIAVQLLSTLWDNLQRSGARTSRDLTSLALLLLDVGNASERLAAARRLVLDDRCREVVLAHLRRARDPELARAIAMAAATDLPGAAAFSVITQAAEIVGQDTAPFLTLAQREPGFVRNEYEQRLGSDVTPRVRALLVAGAGFAEGAEGLEVARLAFSSDPDAEVRLRALFVLTGRAADALGEAAVSQALDDPGIGGDPQRLAAVVLAVENLARQGHINAVHRLGERMRAMPTLSLTARTMLDRLLQEHLPGGGATGGSGQ